MGLGTLIMSNVGQFNNAIVGLIRTPRSLWLVAVMVLTASMEFGIVHAGVETSYGNGGWMRLLFALYTPWLRFSSHLML